MKVLIISTADRAGGGAIAAFRLMEALNKNGVQAKMLVRDKTSDALTVAKAGTIIPKILERLRLMLKLCKPLRKTWGYDTASDGIDILSTPEYQEARVIHLHWVNQGMLSLKQLQKMVTDNKRIVWTLHDEWAFRGVIHYKTDNPGIPERLENSVLQKKKDIYQQGRIRFVGCSQWITDLAREAMPDQDIRHINNCIPHTIFHPTDRDEARQQYGLPTEMKLVLFCSQKVDDERKGMKYLLEAMQILDGEDIGLVIVGKNATMPETHCPVYPIPYIDGEEKMACLYAAVDCFVTPSLQDNLPNTIAESMSCGTPCVGFNAGGIPEMIHHKQDGYVAEYRNSQDLADGIRYVLSHPEFRDTAMHSAAHDYSETRVAQEYIKVYER